MFSSGDESGQNGPDSICQASCTSMKDKVMVQLSNLRSTGSDDNADVDSDSEQILPNKAGEDQATGKDGACAALCSDIDIIEDGNADRAGFKPDKSDDIMDAGDSDYEKDIDDTGPSSGKKRAPSKWRRRGRKKSLQKKNHLKKVKEVRSYFSSFCRYFCIY